MSTSLIPILVTGLVCLILGFVAMAITVGLVVSMRRRSRLQANLLAMAQAPAAPPAAQRPQDRDLAIPLRRFGQAAVFIITGDQDYGYFPAHAPQKMLSSSWGITDGESARAQIEAFLRNASGPELLCFDLVRAIHLARAAAGATFITQDQSWAYVATAARQLQKRYRSWNEVGDAYLLAKNNWLSERNYDTNDGTEAKVERLKREVWPQFPLHTPV